MDDIRYLVSLIERINGLRIDGKTLEQYFRRGSYSDWAFVQYGFVSLGREYSKSHNFEAFLRARTPRRKVLHAIFQFLFECLVVVVTVVGVLSIFVRKIRVVTFSSDFLNADRKPTPRLRNIYNYFAKQKISFIEILHITSVSSFFRNLPHRPHPGLYFEAFSFLGRLWSYWQRRRIVKRVLAGLDLSQFEGDELLFVRFLIADALAHIESLKISTTLYRKVLGFIAPKAFISVDDFRYVPEILLACELEGISTHVFQHSNFGYVPGMYLLSPDVYIFPTQFYTWNSYWKKRSSALSPYFSHYASRIELGGRSFTPHQPPHVSRTESKNGIHAIKVLLPYEVSLRSDYIQPYIDSMLDDERFTILFVLRGTIDQIDYKKQINQYVPIHRRGNPRFVVIEPQKRDEAIRDCDVIAGVYSGFLDESIETGVPVCIFKTPFFHVNRLNEDQLATSIDLEKGSLFTQFEHACRISNAELEERRKRVMDGTIDIEKTLGDILAK